MPGEASWRGREDEAHHGHDAGKRMMGEEGWEGRRVHVQCTWVGAVIGTMWRR